MRESHDDSGPREPRIAAHLDQADDLVAALRRIEDQLRRSNDRPVPTGKIDRGWAWVGLVGFAAVAVAGLVIFSIANRDTGNQLEALHDQIAVVAARVDAMRSNARPWVSAKVAIASDLTVDKGGAHLELRYDLANSGRTPAFNIIVTPLLIAETAGDTGGVAPTAATRDVEARCRNVVRLVSRAARAGGMPWDYAIFPGAQFTARESAGASVAESGSRAAGSTLIVSCIDYRAGAATDHHQTGDMFYLRRVSREAPEGSVDIDLGRVGRIPAAELRLSPAIAGTYAN